MKLGGNRIWKSDEEEMEARRNPWRTASPDEERFPRETSKRSLEDLVAQVVDGGKKRKVGGSFDPEREVGKGIPRMVKVGGMRWNEGIGGVEAALREAGVGFCEGRTSAKKKGYTRTRPVLPVRPAVQAHRT